MFKKSLSIILAIMLFSISAVGSFAGYQEASTNTNYYNTYSDNEEIINDEAIELLKENYYNMSIQEKATFLSHVKYDEELLEFHKTYIDPTSTLTKPRRSKRSSDVYSEVLGGLRGIDIPTVVRYALAQWGAAVSILPALDGPAPIGDGLAVGDTIITIAVVALYWNSVYPHIDEIKDVFGSAFANLGSAIKAKVDKGLNYLFAKAKGEAKKTPDSPSGMQKEVERGQAPREVDRVDKPHVPGQKPHVHFKDKTSMNNDGTLHDAHNGTPNISRKTKKWLEGHGWSTGE